MLWLTFSKFLFKFNFKSSKKNDTKRKIEWIFMSTCRKQVDWKKLGFSKGSLHYMKQNAKSDKPFTLNAHVLERVNNWEALASSQK